MAITEIAAGASFVNPSVAFNDPVATTSHKIAAINKIYAWVNVMRSLYIVTN